MHDDGWCLSLWVPRNATPLFTGERRGQNWYMGPNTYDTPHMYNFSEECVYPSLALSRAAKSGSS